MNVQVVVRIVVPVEPTLFTKVRDTDRADPATPPGTLMVDTTGDGTLAWSGGDTVGMGAVFIPCMV